jgi:hypothetical protein
LARDREGCAAPVMLASTHQRTLDVMPLKAIREHAVARRPGHLGKRSALAGRLLASQAIAGPIWHTMADQR